MKKVMRPFNQKFYGQKTSRPVFIVINTDRNYLSITGVQAPKPNGDALGGCGQIDMEYDHKDKSQNDKRYDPVKVEELEFTFGWNAEIWYTLLDVWKNWHLKKLSDVPQDVLDWLNSLPDTTITPAWC